MKLNNKAQVNQIFVYIMSIIIVLFIGFLVTKFVFTFSSDAQNRASYAIYDTLKTDYKDIYQTYGSEKVLKYKISSDVNEICFISDVNSIDNLVAVFSKNGCISKVDISIVNSTCDLGNCLTVIFIIKIIIYIQPFQSKVYCFAPPHLF